MGPSGPGLPGIPHPDLECKRSHLQMVWPGRAGFPQAYETGRQPQSRWRLDQAALCLSEDQERPPDGGRAHLRRTIAYPRLDIYLTSRVTATGWVTPATDHHRRPPITGY